MVSRRSSSRRVIQMAAIAALAAGRVWGADGPPGGAAADDGADHVGGG